MRLQFDLAARADGTQADNLHAQLRPAAAVLLGQLSGVAGSPQSARIAQIGTDVRNVQTFGKLASAVISSITDVGTYVITPATTSCRTGTRSQLRQGRRQRKDTRDFLTTHGIIAESMMGDLTAGPARTSSTTGAACWRSRP
jgi:hypothetical protein